MPSNAIEDTVLEKRDATDREKERKGDEAVEERERQREILREREKKKRHRSFDFLSVFAMRSCCSLDAIDALNKSSDRNLHFSRQHFSTQPKKTSNRKETDNKQELWDPQGRHLVSMFLLISRNDGLKATQ